MRKNLIGFLIVGVLYTSLFMIYKTYSIQEDTIYSQNLVTDSQRINPNSEGFISRVEAIELANKVFLEGLGIDLTEANISMYVNLFKETQNQEYYNWIMSWYNKDGLDSYSCTIDVKTGEILSIYISGVDDALLVMEDTIATEENIMLVYGAFLKFFDIEENQYELEVTTVTEEYSEVEFVKYVFVNTIEPSKQVVIEIDRQTKWMSSYLVKAGE